MSKSTHSEEACVIRDDALRRTRERIARLICLFPSKAHRGSLFRDRAQAHATEAAAAS